MKLSIKILLIALGIIILLYVWIVVYFAHKNGDFENKPFIPCSPTFNITPNLSLFDFEEPINQINEGNFLNETN